MLILPKQEEQSITKQKKINHKIEQTIDNKGFAGIRLKSTIYDGIQEADGSIPFSSTIYFFCLKHHSEPSIKLH